VQEFREMMKCFFTICALLLSACILRAQDTITLAINEVLFNPAKGGYDYVELCNTGADSVDLSEVFIGNRNVTQDVASLRPVSRERLMLGPRSFAVLTANEKWLKLQYHLPAGALVCHVSQMPSYADDEGAVVLCSVTDTAVIDELKYSGEWHFPLLDDPSGVSLERVNFLAPTQDRNNWMSASSASGFGTPGAQNSQFRADLTGSGEVTVSPKIFSPDNDGFSDFATIALRMKEPGCIANTYIYDASGRRVRYLVKNATLGTANQFIWDGFDDHAARVAKGAYIVYTEIFNLQGYSRKFKNMVVVYYRR
jgi:hypothetical protein